MVEGARGTERTGDEPNSSTPTRQLGNKSSDRRWYEGGSPGRCLGYGVGFGFVQPQVAGLGGSQPRSGRG